MLFASSEANDGFRDTLHRCINTPTIYFGHIYSLRRHITWIIVFQTHCTYAQLLIFPKTDYFHYALPMPTGKECTFYNLT